MSEMFAGDVKGTSSHIRKSSFSFPRLTLSKQKTSKTFSSAKDLFRLVTSDFHHFFSLVLPTLEFIIFKCREQQKFHPRKMKGAENFSNLKIWNNVFSVKQMTRLICVNVLEKFSTSFRLHEPRKMLSETDKKVFFTLCLDAWMEIECAFEWKSQEI